MRKRILWFIPFFLIYTFAIALFVEVTSARADFDIKIENETYYSLLFYMLYKVDHNYRDLYPWPVNMAGGEVQPGATKDMADDRTPGEFIYSWSFRPVDDRTKTVCKGKKIIIIKDTKIKEVLIKQGFKKDPVLEYKYY